MAQQLLNPDICVIGAGSGGLTVAAAAASFGVDVVLIESGKMGGDCLNYGCVPSKALIAAAKHAHTRKESGKFGIEFPEMKVDFKGVHDHIRHVISTIEPHDSVERFEGLGVKVILGTGKFIDSSTVQVADYQIKARRFVISTGSSPAVPPINGLQDVPYFTNETIFDNSEKLDHLIVVGGGPIGMELAQSHARLGVKVTVVEALKVLGRDDPELVEIVKNQVKEDGVELLDETLVNEVKRNNDQIQIVVEQDGKVQTIAGSHLLIATGRIPNTTELGLESAGIAFDKKGIHADSGLKTTNRKVFAIGDVASGPQFTHWAGYQAGLILRNILFRLPIKENRNLLPWVTYTSPELAHCGLSEEQAREQHGEIKILSWDYKENDRAQAERKSEGKIKIIIAKNGKILGADIAGYNAGELISMWGLAISKKFKIRDMLGFVPPYPTFTEMNKRVSVTNYSESTKSPVVRGIIKFLQKFG